MVFLVDNIFAVFDDQVFQKYVGIPMDTNKACLLAVLFFFIPVVMEASTALKFCRMFFLRKTQQVVCISAGFEHIDLL